MKNILVIMLVAGLVAGGAAVGPVTADTFYFDPVSGTGLWSGFNWSVDGCNDNGIDLPSLVDDDVAVICADNTCTLDDAREVLRFDVETDATLIIASGGTLEMGGNDVTSTIDGTIELTGELRPSPAPLTGSHTFVGSGEIVGKANSAQILIETATNRELKSSITIRGALEIGRFGSSQSFFTTAGGLIHADTNGTIKISTHGLADDNAASATLYKVSHASAILEFAMECGGGLCPLVCLHKANFELIEGRLKVSASDGLATRGTVTAEPGAIFDIETIACFSRLEACAGG